MLGVTRDPGQELIIAGNIRVVVVSVEGSRVRLGVEAPETVPVDRREVFERRYGLAATAPG